MQGTSSILGNSLYNQPYTDMLDIRYRGGYPPIDNIEVTARSTSNRRSAGGECLPVFLFFYLGDIAVGAYRDTQCSVSELRYLDIEVTKKY